MSNTQTLNQQLDQYIVLFQKNNPVFAACLTSFRKAAATLYVVGGTIRDLALGQYSPDIDIEVHGLSLAKVQQILAQHGKVRLVGNAFGVLKLDGLAIDWSLPRIDKAGRHPEVTINPGLGIVEALKRRDLTVNAIAYNIFTQELVDPFGGLQDIKDRLLRTPDAYFFVQDPLRFFRVMQFIGRLQFQPDVSLTNICKKMDLTGLSRERIAAEFEKLLLKSKYPSAGFRWLQQVGRLKEILPELYATVGVPQDPEWHPEGDVFEHSMQTLDAAALYTPFEQTDNNTVYQLKILFAALCHDVGKPETTTFSRGRWHSYNHAPVGAPISKQLLDRISMRKSIMRDVATLVRYHMEPLIFTKQKAKVAAYKRLAVKLAPYVTMKDLAFLNQADRLGRNGASLKPLKPPNEMVQLFIQHAKKAGVFEQPIAPLLTGSFLIEYGYAEPGKQLGKLLQKAYNMQIKQNITSRSTLIEYLFDRSKK